MVKVGLLVQLEAKPGKEEELEAFIQSALPLAEAEPNTITWYAIKISATTFGIFDTFRDDNGRQEHLVGKIAEALMAKAPELLAQAPDIKQIDIVAAKLPK